MKRIPLTGEDQGKWFDRDTAIAFQEATRWNGNNHISRATGSQWNHETLYYSRSGRWILHQSSQWQGSLDSYTEIALSEAVAWIINNECLDDDGFNKLPDDVREACEAEVESDEV